MTEHLAEVEKEISKHMHKNAKLEEVMEKIRADRDREVKEMKANCEGMGQTINKREK